MKHKLISTTVMITIMVGLGACTTPTSNIVVAPALTTAPTYKQRAIADIGFCYGHYRPYTVKGKQYWVRPEPVGYIEKGLASWYGHWFHGRKTASGERFDVDALTAAHKTLPLFSVVQVTNLHNGRTINVRINDRGPFIEKRIIDLSYSAADQLGMLKAGVVPVRVRVMSVPYRNSLEGPLTTRLLL